MNIQDRFLKYISFDTQSDPNSTLAPSTTKQLELAKYLKQELIDLNVSDVYLSNEGVLYGRIPSNNDGVGDKIGFIAHYDTAPDASGANIKPQVIENYEGGDIIISSALNMKLSPSEFPFMEELIGHKLITTDGTTLLGADDKAGVAIIMSMVEYLMSYSDFKHNDIFVAFTPDEEVGRGTENFELNHMQADYAYTLDGSHPSEIEYENFNAFSADIIFTGKSIHPGTAKNKMINSLRVAYEFDSMLPVHARPESTEGYEGFNHLHDLQGSCELTHSHYIIRNHDLEKAKLQCQMFQDISLYLNRKYGYTICDVKIAQSYLNMKEHIEECFHIVEDAMKAIESVGFTPKSVPIRGGTDGANLTYMGLPCPNLGTGGFNYHGPYEFVSVTYMEKSLEIVLNLIKQNVGG